MKSVTRSPEKVKNLIWFAALSALAIWQIVIIDLIFVEPLSKHTALAFVDAKGRDEGVRVADFVEFYVAGCMAASADSHRIYDPKLQLRWENKVIAPYHLDSPAYCQYTPPIFIMMIPLAYFTPEAALIIWNSGGLLLASVGALILLGHLGWPWRLRILLVLATLSSSVGVLTLAMGQVSWWYLGLVCLYLYCLFKGKDAWGGVTLALTVVKPHYMAFYLLPPLVFKRWRLLIATCVTGVLLLVVSGSMLGWENIVNYPKYVVEAEILPYGNVYPHKTACIHALLALYFDKSLSFKLSALATAIAFIVSWRMWRMAKKLGSIDSSISHWAMAATILFSLTFSAHTNIHDTLLLAVAAMLTLLPRTNAEPGEKSLWLKIWCLLLITYPITSWLLILPQIANAFFRIPFFVLMLIMSVCALCQFERVEQTYKKKV